MKLALIVVDVQNDYFSGGAMTHMCIDTTVRAAFDLGYQCKLIADACATPALVTS